jgi:hypothetical protein
LDSLAARSIAAYCLFVNVNDDECSLLDSYWLPWTIGRSLCGITVVYGKKIRETTDGKTDIHLLYVEAKAVISCLALDRILQLLKVAFIIEYGLPSRHYVCLTFITLVTLLSDELMVEQIQGYLDPCYKSMAAPYTMTSS